MNEATPDNVPVYLQSSLSAYITLEKYISPNVWKRLNREDLACESGDPVLIEDYVKPLFSKCPFDMRRYGTAKQLGDNIHTFRDFPGAHKVFGDDPCNMFFTNAVCYYNAKSELFITKQNVFVSLQDNRFKKFIAKGPSKDLVRAVLAAYLKSHEAKLESVHEFVGLDELHNSFNCVKSQEMDRKLAKKLNQVHREPSEITATIHGVLEKIREIVPGWNEKDYSLSIKMIHEMWDVLSEELDGPAPNTFLDAIEVMIESISSIISAFPHVYQLNKYDPDSTETQYVRLFEDGGQRFVMTDELNRVASVPGNKMSTKYLTTVDEKTALELIQTRAHHPRRPVEFIIFPIPRAQHSAVPIRTPHKGHCKLAIDLLLELVQDLIFGVKVFQKLKKSEWPLIVEFFKNLQHHFNHQEKESYFIRLDDYEKDDINRLNFFEKYDDRPTKNNRNAKADGFTAQNLRNELVYLGFEELFPDVTRIAEQVYNDLVNEKEGQILQTSDLFMAVGRCVSYSLFQALPDIKEFVRNQGKNFWVFHIDVPSPPASTDNRFNDTKWKWIDMADIDVKNTNSGREKLARVDKKIILPDGTELYYNDSALAEAAKQICVSCPKKLDKFFPINDRDFEVFLMDSKEVKWLSSEYRKGETIESRLYYASRITQMMMSISSDLGNKVLYLRTFWLSPINRRELGFVFLKDAYNVLLFAMQQQLGYDKFAEEAKNNSDLWETYVQKVGKKWTLNMKELKELLEFFDVDKSRIILVPDIAYASSVLHQMPLNVGCATFKVLGPDRQELYDPSQAVFRVFQEVVCDIDWSKEITKAFDPNIPIFAFHSEILAAMMTIAQQPCVPAESVEECLKALKSEEYYKECKKKLHLTPLIKLFDCDINDSISVAFFLSECERYGIHYQAPPDMNKKALCNTYLHIWKARLLFLYEWNRMFFDFHSGLRAEFGYIETLMQGGIYHRTPLINWESEGDFMKLIVGTNPKQQEHIKTLQMTSAPFLTKPRNHEWLKNTYWRDRTYIKRSRKWEVFEKYFGSGDVEIAPTPQTILMLELEKSGLMDEVLKDQILMNERKVITIMSKIVKYSESMKKTSGRTTLPDPPPAPSLRESSKDQGSSVVDKRSQQEKKSSEKEMAKEKRQQKSQSPVSVPDSKAAEKPEKSMPNDSKCATQKVQDTPSTSVDLFEAQRKEMDEMKQMIKMLQEEVRGSKQPALKTVPLETHQKEVNELKLKIEKLDEKCRRTSDLCNERTGELKAAKQKLEKLEKKESAAEKRLKEIREKEKGKPTREQLEKELKETRELAEKLKEEKATAEQTFQKKVEEIEQEKAEQVRLLQESAESNRALKQELESQRLTSASEAEQLNIRIAELESFYSESQERIQFFKQQFPKEIIDSFNFRPSLEMRKALSKLRTDQDSVLGGKHSDIAEKKVLKLKKMTDDPKVRDLSEYYLTDYKDRLSDFSRMITENIHRIQANPLIVSSELLPHPEFPELHDYIDEETKKAQQVINEKIERECMCCLMGREREGGWWLCPICGKKCHLICLQRSWEHGGSHSCPHCRLAIV